MSPFHDAHASIYYVCNCADVTAILRDDETFSSTVGGFESTLIYQDGEAHPRIRRRLMPLFSLAKVVALQANIGRLSDALVDAVLARGDCDFVAEIETRSWLRRKLSLRTGVERAAAQVRSLEGLLRTCLSLDKDDPRIDLVLVLVVAGTETTANLIGKGRVAVRDVGVGGTRVPTGTPLELISAWLIATRPPSMLPSSFRRNVRPTVI